MITNQDKYNSIEITLHGFSVAATVVFPFLPLFTLTITRTLMRHPASRFACRMQYSGCRILVSEVAAG